VVAKIAIMVDGGFYLRRAHILFGEKNPEDRADEIHEYCCKHQYYGESKWCKNELYRIFYYDCPPSTKKVYNPLTKKQVDLGKSDIYSYMTRLHERLRHLRKVALRLGNLSENELNYVLKPEALKKLCQGTLKFEDIQEKDLILNIEQKGVDMRIGLDIASVAYKKQVDRIVLISGDSDFVPAAKLARREGIDVILDPMWANVNKSLYEHIDGLHTYAPRLQNNKKENSI